MSKQFNVTRGAFLAFVKELDEKTADIQAAYFNNTIRWHIGHVLAAYEGLLFGYPDHSSNIPADYNSLFATGTKPADWNTEPPKLADLTKHLEEQQNRINDLTDDFLAKELPFELPFGNFKTYDDIFEFLLQHENEHLGKMKAMKQVVSES
ncbi:hypothetical protein CIL03_15740 [Virgibacillus indicus]|uniref:DinB-like domain-containing protein n=1 Tax=Virgibacillus indicus TaxID=2024554 RepID=A0A265N6A6_9BACI|nr:DinB family protein [Virgibacillus indicus]OZU87543.1 hypothetical protein CIL03_15740 [Virgibacillus indicus]